MTLEGLRHSEVVALIKGGEEVRLLVVGQEADELFLTLGLPPTVNHVEGHLTNSLRRLTRSLTHRVCFWLLHHRGARSHIG